MSKPLAMEKNKGSENPTTEVMNPTEPTKSTDLKGTLKDTSFQPGGKSSSSMKEDLDGTTMKSSSTKEDPDEKMMKRAR